MTVKVFINGFGRIGRNVLRAIVESGRRDIEVVALNDLGPVETNAHLLRYDSVHGRFPSDVKVDGDAIVVDGQKIKVTAIKDPAALPHKALKIDIALECTGIFTSKATAKAHLDAGAKRVLVSAPADGADLTVVYGVNHDKLTKDHLVVSNASCTTNCLAPVAKVLHDAVGIDIALECTGIFTSKEKASVHLKAGAKRVLVSAPSDGADLTVVYGVNHDKLTKQHLVVSNASCTTNCLAPVVKVLHDAVGIEKGFMTTVHAYTNDQPSLDQVHKDLYRARAAALSMIPTSTGAAKAVGLVLPELAGKLDGVAIRVPTANVSAIDFKFVAKRNTTKDEINAAVTRAAEQQLKGILAYTDQKNVSVDFNHDPHSSIFHMDQTKVMDGTLVRVMSWYDNEWGFSNRMVDTAVAMGKVI